MSESAIRHSHGPSDSDSLTKYMQEIRAYALLTRAEEVALAQRIRAGDTAALDRLVCSNLRFVVSVAKKYQNRGVPLADLINEGNLGLIRAAEKFDDAKAVKFISYAVWWVRQSIIQALAEHGHTVRVPLNRAGLLHRISRHANVLRHELGREPTQDEITAGLTPDEAQFANTQPIARPYLSLDAPIVDNQDAKLLDYLADEASAAPDEDVVDGDIANSVDAALAGLRPREAAILRLYFGFDGKEPMTLERIGASLGVTRERVRQIKEKALSRLRKPDAAAALGTLRAR